MSIQTNVSPLFEEKSENSEYKTTAKNVARTSRKWITQELAIDIISSVEFSIVFLVSVVSQYLYFTLFKDSLVFSTDKAVVGLIGALFCYFVFHTRGHYTRENIFEGNFQSLRILRGVLFSFMLLVFFAYALKIAEDYSRGWFFVWFVLTFVSLSVSRKIAQLTITSLTERGFFSRNIAIYGAGQIGSDILHHFKNKGSGINVVGVYDDAGMQSEDVRSDFCGSLNDLIQDGLENKFDQIIVATSSSENRPMLGLINAMSISPVDIQVCPDQMRFGLGRPKVDFVGDLCVLGVYGRPIVGWGSLAKSALDYVGALLLILSALPIMILTAIAIKIDSKGPVFFRQRRHGLNHRVIDVFKFRSMTVMEDGNDIKQASKGDKRITRVGQFIRKMSIDELPQLFNVIRGEMSLVGPRPHARAHNEHFSQLLENYANRHKVKPGITGYAQIKGYRGETQGLEEMKKRAEADMYYIENWSIWMDLRILITTPFVLWFQKKAY